MRKLKKKKNNYPYFSLFQVLKSALTVFIIIFFIHCAGNKKNTGNEKKYASLEASTKYVGMNECRQCHADIFETFTHTGMGLSIDAASKKKSSAKFNGHALVYDSIKDFYYKPYWENDSLKFLEFRLHGRDTVHKRIEIIDFIVGSGQHTNSHMYEMNGYFHQAPLTFYTQKSTWDLPPGFENGGNSRFSRIIGLECMTCHNGYPDFVLGSENKYEKIKTGIDCERCHGPGEKHVAEKRSGKILDVTKEIDYSIVNPSKLPVDLQFDVCQRCHIQGNAVLNDNKSFFDFRPGMKLSEVMNIFMPVWNGRENEHIMASHAERLKMSDCFIKTSQKITSEKTSNELRPYKNGITCITCHNPHVSVRVTNNNQFNNTCRSCHTPVEKNECSASEKVRMTKQDNCVTCHMVTSSTTDIPHVSVTDHYIRKPVDEKEIEKIKTFVGIACINNPSPPSGAIGNAFIAYYEKFGFDTFVLDSAKKYFPDNSEKDIRNNFHSLVHLYYLKKDYPKILSYVKTLENPLTFLNNKSYSNTDAWTCYRIGQALENTGASNAALVYYKQAIDLAPYHLQFQNVYGSQLMGAGMVKEAKQVFEFVLKEFPANTTALSNLGFICLSTDGDTAKARYLYEKALSLDPDYLAAQYNVAGLYIYTKQFAKAKSVLNKILAKYPAEQKAKQILSSLQSL